MLRHAAIIAVVVFAAPIASRGEIVFNFASLPTGTPTPLSMTEGGITASFSAPSDPGAFSTENALTSPLWASIHAPPLSGGYVLSDDATVRGSSLTISFSPPVVWTSSIPVGLDFAWDGRSGAPETVLLYTAAGLAVTLGPNPSPTADVSFKSYGFGFYLNEPLEKIVIESPSAIALYDVYIGTTSVQASVPEPSAVILALFGIPGYFVIRRFWFNLKPTRPGACAGRFGLTG